MKITSMATLCGIVWALSFFLSLGMIPPLEIERLGAVVIGLLSLGPVLLAGRVLPIRSITAPRIAFCTLCLWVIATLSCSWSVSPPISLIYLGIFSLLPATILAMLLADADLSKSFIRSAMIGTGLIIVGLAFWALVQIFFLPELLVNGQVRNPFSNPNVFASLLSLSFFTGLGFALREKNRLIYLFILTGLFLILSAFIAMAGKAASMAMAAGLIFLFLAFGKTVFLPRWKSLLAVVVGVMIVEILIAHLPERANLAGQMASMLNGNVLSSRVRLDLWQATLNMIAKHPLLGTGYRTWFLLYPEFRLTSEVYSGGYMAHNDPLQLWAEIGILGPIFFYATAIGVLLRFLKFWRGRTGDPKEQALTLSLFLGCAAMIAHSHVDFPFYALPTMMAFALALSMLMIRTGPDPESRPLSFMAQWPKGLAQMGLIAPVAALMVLFIPLMIAEYQTTRGEHYLNAQDLERFGNAVNAANTIGFGMNDRPYLLATSVPLGILQSQTSSLSREEQIKLFHQIDNLITRALLRNQRLASAWHQRGVMLLYLDQTIPPTDYPTAEYCFKKTLTLNPLYLPSRLALADLYERQGNKKAALEVLAEGLQWPYSTIEAYAYYDRTEKLARMLKQDTLLPAIETARTMQKARVKPVK